MPTEVSDDTSEYVNGVSSYILRITGTLINGQKAVVKITGIKPFFDVEVPEEMSLSTFKTRLVNILSNTLKGTSKFGIENINAFPLRGYHIEKKSYIRVITWNQFDRYNALKAVREVGICTASDDLTPIYYYRKVAREKRLPLSSWAMLSNYFHEYIQGAEKSSLAYYLKECGLDNKLDMPFQRMFKYYGMALKETNATTAEQMREVAEYCIIDAISCQRLMVKHNAINEYREVASVAFISLYDSHYFAVGMKVRNLLSAGAWQEGILTSTIPCEQMETGKYPGAYVFPPRAESLKESGIKLHVINFKYNGWDVLAWSIEHGNQAEMKGLYPKVLEELLIRRNTLKRRLAPLNDRKEELEKEISLAEAKVYMNTFYGEARNSGSPFFLRALAGGVTSAGQRNIKLIADLVRSKRFGVKYGDTDSLYLVCPEECFQECDEAYDSGNGISKEEYWSRMVNISMEEIERLRDEVNDFLKNDNGSSYLKMAYEEVLFPVVFTGKKKYYGIPHRRQPNFNNKLFIRGVEIVKRG
ncbi:DNA/RNA polymerase [Rhizophagus irregularis]|uniref:DNA polymerase n=1 Tax=Rhizophagus irregularis TaxID=588596 RepID=A0A2N1MLJ1_9GLOM|nr:DNA/RNA polymerase [Rhizophagus irregularis]